MISCGIGCAAIALRFFQLIRRHHHARSGQIERALRRRFNPALDAARASAPRRSARPPRACRTCAAASSTCTPPASSSPHLFVVLRPSSPFCSAIAGSSRRTPARRSSASLAFVSAAAVAGDRAGAARRAAPAAPHRSGCRSPQPAPAAPRRSSPDREPSAVATRCPHRSARMQYRRLVIFTLPGGNDRINFSPRCLPAWGDFKADVAQLVEQPIRNRQVTGSSPVVGSIR